MTTRRLRLICLPLVFCLGLISCGPTKWVNTWKNPTAQPVSWRGEKIAAFVIAPVESTRQGAETTLAREITERGAIGIAGHTVLPLEVIRKDQQRARQMLESEGITGAVLMRLVGNDQVVNYTPGTVRYVGGYYPTFWGYWNYGWATVYEPGYLSMDRVVSVETRLYSLPHDQLLWAGTSTTTNPKNVQAFLKELCDAVGKEVRKSGLMAP